MPALAIYAANVLAILVLVFGLYFPRHRRRDLVAAYGRQSVGNYWGGSSDAATRALDASRLIDARLRHDDRDALSLLYDLTRDLARARDVAELASATATRLFAAFPRATHVTLFLVDGGEPAPAHRHQTARTTAPASAARSSISSISRR